MPAKPDHTMQPEVLPPGTYSRPHPGTGQTSGDRRGAALLHGKTRWFDDENLDMISHVLDDWLRIPGTSIRFGLYGIVGLIPGFGNLAGGLASLILLVAAWVRGVPYVTLTRMVANVAISVIGGTIPFAGDIFDVGWKANRRNYKLLTRHLAQPHQHTWKDWAFVGVLGAAMVAAFLAPVILLVLLLRRLGGHF